MDYRERGSHARSVYETYEGGVVLVVLGSIDP